jgi:large subunit ribosomal protein L21
MFAVVKTGGKQYRVAPGDVIRVEKLAAEAGAVIELVEVLMLGGDGAGIEVGRPRIEGAAVTATVLAQTRGDKILVFKKKRRHNYRRKKGHRQDLTVLQIAEILPPGAERKPRPPEAREPAQRAEAATAAEAKAAQAKAAETKAAGTKPPAAKAAVKKAAPKKAAAPAAKAGKAAQKKPAAAGKAKGKGGKSKGKE